MDFPVPMRKRNRLQNYDYRQGGSYFITICTLYKRCIFGFVADKIDGSVMQLNKTGKLVEAAILEISDRYPTVSVTQHIVMPNHIHLLLSFDTMRENPSLSTVINQFKGSVTKMLGQPTWQKGYYDHIIRTEAEYRSIGEYIEHNAAKWKTDTYYSASEAGNGE